MTGLLVVMEVLCHLDITCFTLGISRQMLLSARLTCENYYYYIFYAILPYAPGPSQWMGKDSRVIAGILNVLGASSSPASHASGWPLCSPATVAVVRHSAAEHFVLFFFWNTNTLMQVHPFKEIIIIYKMYTVLRKCSSFDSKKLLSVRFSLVHTVKMVLMLREGHKLHHVHLIYT